MALERVGCGVGGHGVRRSAPRVNEAFTAQRRSRFRSCSTRKDARGVVALEAHRLVRRVPPNNVAIWEKYRQHPSDGAPNWPAVAGTAPRRASPMCPRDAPPSS
jgi:hypothetical protein